MTNKPRSSANSRHILEEPNAYKNSRNDNMSVNHMLIASQSAQLLSHANPNKQSSLLDSQQKKQQQQQQQHSSYMVID